MIPRSRATVNNAAYGGSITAMSRPQWDSIGYIKEAAPLPPLLDYIDDAGTAEVVRDCQKHYMRISQDDIGNPATDLSCPELRCRKVQGFDRPRTTQH